MSADQSGRTHSVDVDFTGPKNGEDCDACKADPDGLCLYHRGYDEGWAAGSARPESGLHIAAKAARYV